MKLTIRAIKEKEVETIFEKKVGNYPVVGYIDCGTLGLLVQRNIRNKKTGEVRLTPLVSLVLTKKELELALATIKGSVT